MSGESVCMHSESVSGESECLVSQSVGESVCF